MHSQCLPKTMAGMCNGERVSDYDGGVWDCVKVVRPAASGGSNSGGGSDIDSGSGVAAESDGVEADGAGNSQSDSCGGGGRATNANVDSNGQGGLGGDDGFVRGGGDHVGDSAEGGRDNGVKSNGFDGNT